MKVAIVNETAGFGSHGRIAYQLSRIPGVQGRIYYGRKENTTDADAFRVTTVGGIAAHATGTFLTDRHGFYNTKETERMVEDLKKFQPDLVHLHNLHGYWINVKVLFDYLKESGIPVVWTLHDCWSFTGHCAHYDSIHCEKWKTGCEHCPGLNRYPWTWTGRNVARNYEDKKEIFTSLGNQMTSVPPSFWLADQISHSFLKGIPVRTIHNGIDGKLFHPVISDFRKKNNLEGKFVILAVASVWSKDKGLQDLQRLSRNLDEQQKLVVVGLNALQKSGFNKANTICIGHTANVEELCGIYSSADLFLNLTYEDTFPTVNLEAQACGCPVLTYRTGGSPESLTEDTGIVIDKGSIDRLIPAIAQMHESPEHTVRQACMENARRFTVDNMLNAYKNLYEDRTGILL